MKTQSNPYGALTSSQVEERMQQGLYNKDSTLPTKTVKRIIFENIFTLFNIINFVLAVALLVVGSYKNMLFMGVVFSNIAIGTFQEIRAKRTIDKLSIISASAATVVRDGQICEIEINNIVQDDVIILRNGQQVPADCVVLDGFLQANESLLTGEAKPLDKKPGDALLSGSFIASGKCYARVTGVGEKSYANELVSGAKYVKKVNSEIMNSIKLIIKIVSTIIVPMGIFLFLNQIKIPDISYHEAITGTVAALIGMIPEGLVLLTSTVLAVSVIRLSKYKVLVQELYCIETLAQVDVLCLDKTGTITEGTMQVSDVLPVGAGKMSEAENALTAIAASLDDCSPTLDALRERYNSKPKLKTVKTFPFSSEKKCSGIQTSDGTYYIMGAAEFILNEVPDDIKRLIDTYSGENRVLTLTKSPDNVNFTPIGLVLIKDKIRETAEETLRYFESQGIDLKIISGDNVKTVAAVAKAAGMKNHANCIDARELDSYEKVKSASEKYSVFGRVTPVQKKQLILALKEQGHKVAMTGDGVNDVLALKEADCSVAMASGSDAARNVSQLVLLNSDFASMPKVVAEGRRSINNIQRSASLFLVKTIFFTILAVMFVFVNANYPFQPIQMSLISSCTIGIPSLILGLEPNHERIKGKFFLNVISKAVPAALTMALNVAAIITVGQFLNWYPQEISTLVVMATAFTGFLTLFKVCSPFNKARAVLFGTMVMLFVMGITVGRRLFSIHPPSIELVIAVCAVCLFAFGVFMGILRLSEKVIKK